MSNADWLKTHPNINNVNSCDKDIEIFLKSKQIHYKRTQKEWRENNKDKISDKNKRYNTCHREENTERARKRRAEYKYSDVTVEYLRELRDNTTNCLYCNVDLINVKVELDHIIPLSRQGSHTKNNILYCR